MSTASFGDVQRVPDAIDPTSRTGRSDHGVKSITITPQLEEFMSRICDLVDNHPEWIHQNQPERMKNFLSAVREL